MVKVAIVVLADTESHADLGRLFNAMEVTKEFKEANDEVRLIFDGAGTKWVAEMAKPDHKLHDLFNSLKDKISGACSYCSSAFGVKDEVQACGVTLLGEYDGHPSLRTLVAEGYQVITF